jgi:hypothetical protein
MLRAKSVILMLLLALGLAVTGSAKSPAQILKGRGIQLNEAPAQPKQRPTRHQPASKEGLIPRLDPDQETYDVVVNAVENCIFMNQVQNPAEKAVQHPLKADSHYKIRIEGEAWLSDHRGDKADPVPGMILFYSTNEQDGYATQMKVLKPGDELVFETPKKQSEDLFLSAFFIDYWPESQNRGSYTLKVTTYSKHPVPRGQPSAEAGKILNINFGRHPGNMIFDGVVGGPHDHWTLVDVGERKKDALKLADGTETDVTMEISENDGEWGIAGHAGVYHAYLYHNCRCVDLSAKFDHLAAGMYEVYVFAHGDAPDQNAKIVIESAGTTYSGRKTVNDATYRYKSHDLQEGVQYVKYTIQVEAGKPVTITSLRDGSTLSMLNAIQIKRLEVAE